MNDMLITPRLRDENNQQYAYRIIKNNIMRTILKPGELLDERILSDTLGMSRTPIREALISLKQEYLVDIYPQRKTRVSLIDLSIVEDGLFVRSKIEPYIFETLMENPDSATFLKLKENLVLQKQAISDEEHILNFLDYDNSFHKIMYLGAGKEKIWDCISSISAQFNRIRYFDTLFGSERLSDVYAEHEKLFNVLITKNSDHVDTKELVEEHLSGYQINLPRLLEYNKEYF